MDVGVGVEVGVGVGMDVGVDVTVGVGMVVGVGVEFGVVVDVGAGVDVEVGAISNGLHWQHFSSVPFHKECCGPPILWHWLLLSNVML